MLRTGGLACVRSTRFLVGPSRLSAAHPLALLTSSRTSQRPGWGAAGSSRGLCAAPEVSPKIQALVDQISELTLLEASELTDALKENLPRADAPALAKDGSFGSAAIERSGNLIVAHVARGHEPDRPDLSGARLPAHGFLLTRAAIRSDT